MTALIRQASLADVETICHHRRAMFFDMGHRDEAALDAMTGHFRPWLRERMTSGEYQAWFAIADTGEIAAGLGLWLMRWAPHMIAPDQPRGNIVNVYTERQFRRQGLARRLMETSLEWCREQGIRTVILHASAEGRALYESMGFAQTNEMRMQLEPKSTP